MTRNPQVEELARSLSETLADQGKIVEGGWIAFRSLVIPPTVSQAQLDDMRTAFFAGAYHLFATINTVLDPGEEPTERDLERMSLVHAELEKFKDEVLVPTFDRIHFD